MVELGSGSGSSYPSALDTNTTLEENSPNPGKTKARKEVPNDHSAAIVAIQGELGTDPAGTLSDVKTFLQTEHDTDGTHNIPAISLLASTVPIRDSSRGLIVVANTTNPTYQVDIDADEIILHDSSSLLFKATSVNVTVNITASGANGLDTGSEAASTNYYIWVIYDAVGTTTAGMLSLSKTAPTMPGNYTYKALVGELYNDSGSDVNYINWWNGTYFLDGEVGNNDSSVTVTSSKTTIATIDIGTVTIGDRIKCEANCGFAKGATRGLSQASIEYSSGTATIEWQNNTNIVSQSDTMEVSDTGTKNIHGTAKVTGSGTLVIKLSATSVGSDSNSGGQILGTFLKKQ